MTWRRSATTPRSRSFWASSYAIDTGERLLLVDPLAVPAEAERLASGRQTAIVLTCPWHERDARAVGERLGAPIFVPPPDEGDADPTPVTVFAARDRLPGGVQAFLGLEPMTSCSGSRAGAPSSSATPSATAATVSRSP